MTQLHPLAVQNAALFRELIKVGHERAASLAELADRLGRDKSNLSKSLKTLAAEGFVNAETRDLTDAGADQLAAIMRAEGGADMAGKPGLPTDEMAATGILLLRHDQIVPDPDNARKDWDSDEAQADLAALADDIAERDLLQNLIVKPGPDGDREPLYTLVGGERRWRAIGLLIADGRRGADTLIPVRLRQSDDLGHRLAALSENLKRRNLNPNEKAEAFEGLAALFAAMGIEDKKINREIADRVGVTIEHVQQHRSFMSLDEADRARLTLPKDDPRRLTVSEARKKVSANADAEAKAAAFAAIPVEQRLAMAEILHAVATRGKHSWDRIVVRAGFAESEVGQGIAALDWVQFEGPCDWGDDDIIGHYLVKRGYGVPYDIAHPFAQANAEERDAALAKVQEEAGHTDRTDYVTEWLNPPFDLDDAGRAAVAADQQYRAERAKQEEFSQQQHAANVAAREAAKAREAAVVAQARDLFTTHRQTPPPADVVADLAQAADSPLPWRIRHDNSVVAADGSLVIGPGPSDRSEARMRLLVLALNALAQIETPEDEPDPNPALDRDAFITAVGECLESLGFQLSEGETFESAATDALDQNLDINGTEFGDEAFDWTRDGAQTLAEAHMAEAEEGEEAEQAYAAADHEEHA